MYDFDVGVVAEHRYENRYEVFCNRCAGSLGVMAYVSIMDAVFSTMHRGGVLCPSCRESTCDVCGAEVPADIRSCEEGPKGKVWACPGCAEYIVETMTRIKEAITN